MPPIVWMYLYLFYVIVFENQGKKFTCLGISGKMKDFVSLCNNTGLISKVSEGIASKSTDNCRCRQLHCRLTPPLQATPANIRMNLILPETRIPLLYFRCWQFGPIFIQIFVLGSERRMLCVIECVMAVQSHLRSLILTPIETAYATIPIVINSDLGPILHRFWDRATYCLKIANFSYPILI